MILALLAAAACSGDCAAQKKFLDAEARVLAKPVKAQIHSHAEGSVKADADSLLEVGVRSRLTARGSFMGTPFDKTFDQPTTPELRDALLIGLVRMGVLHNVVNLMAGQAPDHSTGGAREWLTPHDFKPLKNGVAYKLRLAAREAGEAKLYFDKRGFPELRDLLVHFPQGDMHVIETYQFSAPASPPGRSPPR